MTKCLDFVVLNRTRIKLCEALARYAQFAGDSLPSVFAFSVSPSPSACVYGQKFMVRSNFQPRQLKSSPRNTSHAVLRSYVHPPNTNYRHRIVAFFVFVVAPYYFHPLMCFPFRFICVAIVYISTDRLLNQQCD